MTITCFQIVASLVAWNREDLMPQVCEEASIQNFDHRHVILLPLMLSMLLNDTITSQYIFKITTACSLTFVLLMKHACLNLLGGNPCAPKLLQMIVKAKKTCASQDNQGILLLSWLRLPSG